MVLNDRRFCLISRILVRFRHPSLNLTNYQAFTVRLEARSSSANRTILGEHPTLPPTARDRVALDLRLWSACRLNSRSSASGLLVLQMSGSWASVLGLLLALVLLLWQKSREMYHLKILVLEEDGSHAAGVTVSAPPWQAIAAEDHWLLPIPMEEIPADGTVTVTARKGEGFDEKKVHLAQLLQATNWLSEAEPLMKRALAIDEASLGPKHPLTMIRAWNLLVLYWEGEDVDGFRKLLPNLMWLLGLKDEELRSGDLRTIRDLLGQQLQRIQKAREKKQGGSP